ncbi:MAG: pantetheine-phosphate adenylyltransferase [Trueperaceae bacterium]|nr:pantetheine-phosphate adenylyltransferase [Trueperaceae bacterium]
MSHAVFPGSFDPIHNGHVDIIRRASKLFDQLTVAVLNNPYKQNKWFDSDERLELIETVIQGLPNVKAEVFEGLLVNYVRDKGAEIILKSLRNVSDFEYEVSMAHMNQHMYERAETTFLLTRPEWSYLSSTRVKEIVSYGVDVSDLVPAVSLQALKKKFS